MTTATRLTSRDSHITVRTDRTAIRGLDLIAVERAVNGEPPQGITDAELAYADQILWSRDVSRAEAARRLDLPYDLLRDLRNDGWNPKVITTGRTETQGAAA
ncbi:hypothetical protein ACIBL8_21495 [Streptomyces sp. NPDC050523]|uniref:hypothetical protein n=1 Tax=Streptomyces sp. NPDC050523 TaxID=3365622 RepID=UPI0037B3CF2E